MSSGADQPETRFASTAGPQRTAEAISERLLMLSGVFMKFADTGALLDTKATRNLILALDRSAADATRLAGEIGELTDMIFDLAEGAAAHPPKGPPSLRVIEGNGRC